MSKIKKFEDVRAWQIARQLNRSVHLLTENGSFNVQMRDDIRRTAAQAMHGIAEGYAAGSDFEFIHFLRQSQRATAKLQSQLYTAVDCTYINKDQFRKIFDEAEVVKAQLLAFIVFLNKKQATSSSALDANPFTKPPDEEKRRAG